MGQTPEMLEAAEIARNFLFRDHPELAVPLTPYERRKTKHYCYGCSQFIAPYEEGIKISGKSFHKKLTCVCKGIKRTPRIFAVGVIQVIAPLCADQINF